MHGGRRHGGSGRGALAGGRDALDSPQRRGTHTRSARRLQCPGSLTRWESSGQAQSFGCSHPSFNSTIFPTPSNGLTWLLRLAFNSRSSYLSLSSSGITVVCLNQPPFFKARVSPCSRGWLQILNPPTSAFPILGLQVWVTISRSTLGSSKAGLRAQRGRESQGWGQCHR